MNKLLLSSAALAVSILAGPAVTWAATVNTDSASSGETSTTTAAENSASGNIGFGNDMAGAAVTSTNQAFDNSFASIAGATLKTNTQGGDQGSIVGTSFSKGTGFDFGIASQTGTSTGSDTGKAAASHVHK